MSITRDQIGAVARSLGLQERDGQPACRLVASQTYRAALEEVWDALTTAERIPRWFLPISGDLRPGGWYQLEGNAGGVIEACEPPRRLAITWEYGGDVSWVEVVLTASGPGTTTLELRHTFGVDNDHWREFGPGATGIGWDMALLGLRGHLAGEGAEVVRPEDAAAWMASDDGRLFMTLSSEAWCEAGIAAGTGEEQARGAAARCLAAYTAS